MTDEQMEELDALYADLARMKKALKDIMGAEDAVMKRVNRYSKYNEGLLAGLRAAGILAHNTLKENADGRQEEASRTIEG